MLELKNIFRTYEMGETTVYALNDVSLKIDEGDFVAIMGASGSGKSTLLHILGLLDTPDSGSYRFAGREVAHLSEDEQTKLRSEVVGFIFQQFNLLPRMSAIENTAMPTLYTERKPDLERAGKLLSMLGMGERLGHRPNELSGGQQQRVAIARSLINSPKIIFADEPTGNLDSASSEEIISQLKELNRRGITIVLVTHEAEIGKKANRLIRMKDGKIESDQRLAPIPPKVTLVTPPVERVSKKIDLAAIWETVRQGLKTLSGNKVRTALSMLGILIGVAAVVAMMAVGKGAQKAIENQLSSLGSNLLMVRSGGFSFGGVSMDAGSVTRLNLEDVNAIKETVEGVKEASPNVSGKVQVVFQNNNWSTQLQGVGTAYEEMRAASPAEGRFFAEEENGQRKRLALIGRTVARELFDSVDPVGEMIKINKINFQVIGILPPKGAQGPRDQDDVIVIPVLTAMDRLLGKDYIDSIDVQMEDGADMDVAQEEILALMFDRHNVPLSQQQNAFQVRNMADIQAALSSSSKTMSLLLAFIAAISLVVGGIGIMNIMLVSVTERTREIGLRKAIGAGRNDILYQFVIESVVVSVIGGIAGILLGGISTLIITLISGWATSISPQSVFLAFFFSALVGIVFGIYPASKASKLDPIEALRYE